jgi:hypothetical protein
MSSILGSGGKLVNLTSKSNFCAHILESGCHLLRFFPRFHTYLAGPTSTTKHRSNNCTPYSVLKANEVKELRFSIDLLVFSWKIVFIKNAARNKQSLLEDLQRLHEYYELASFTRLKTDKAILQSPIRSPHIPAHYEWSVYSYKWLWEEKASRFGNL